MPARARRRASGRRAPRASARSPAEGEGVHCPCRHLTLDSRCSSAYGRCMARSPKLLLDRPKIAPERAIDVLADILAATRMSTLIHGRLELSAPWGIQFPEANAAHLYVLARGGARLELAGASPAILASGHVAFLPHGVRHCLRHTAHSPLPSPDPGECPPRPAFEPVRLGPRRPPTTPRARAIAF